MYLYTYIFMNICVHMYMSLMYKKIFSYMYIDHSNTFMQGGLFR